MANSKQMSGNAGTRREESVAGRLVAICLFQPVTSNIGFHISHLRHFRSNPNMITPLKPILESIIDFPGRICGKGHTLLFSSRKKLQTAGDNGSSLLVCCDTFRRFVNLYTIGLLSMEV